MADVKDQPTPPKVQDEVSKSLADFLDQAVGAGLLSSPAGSESETLISGDPKVDTNCPSLYPLDFSQHIEVRRYADLTPYRDAVVSQNDASSRLDLIKSYLALGLYTEVMAVGLNTGDASTSIYAKIAMLMDGRKYVDALAFKALSECHKDAELWQGISALSANDVSGAVFLESHIEAFRDLPLQLRSDVAVLVLPTLRHGGETLLGNKLLATFSTDEVEASDRLNIQASFLRAASDYVEGTQSAYDFLAKISPAMDGLLSGIEAGQDLSDAQKAILLDEAYNALSRSRDEGDIAVALKFVLEDLHQRADYRDYTTLLDMQSLAGQAFQFEIKEHLARKLTSDLQGENDLTRMLAIEMLANHPDLMSSHSAHRELTSEAMRFLKSESRFSLASTLLEPEELAEKEVLLSARLAEQQKDTARLYAIGRQHMDSPEVVHIAALAAVQESNADVFRQFERYLPQQADILLALAEEDAVVGGWLLSEQSYQNIRKSAKPSQLERLEQVLSLKAMKDVPAASARASVSQSIRNRLASSDALLERFAKGIR